ncbi:bla regulator protein blaR1 [Anaerovirgula multivorans]|uniref:Beta-lactamase n=1 Tax=Anaerovirgula multivorans TaxID=312168 RepID=A0A239IVL1_9FIRM|nr:BlaR1 family beta-lactam sensor/signal transducer [Anaerovirgula multivorans]SNS96464.1 bla regulator protein blaR1 [Anaerovirgula multivorans]
MEPTGFLFWLANTSFIGSILIGIILYIKKLFHKKFHTKWHYYVWFLLVVRLVMPYAPKSPLSIINGFLYIRNYIVGHGIQRTSTGDTTGIFNEAVGSIETVDFHEDYFFPMNEGFSFLIYRILFIIWLAGVIAITVYLVIQHIKFLKWSRKCSDINCFDLLQLFEECKTLLNIKKHINLIETNEIRSPAFFGMIRPCILLPVNITEKLGLKKAKYILLHELIHYKNRDVYINWIICFLKIIHWFNPIIWYGFYHMQQDREIACDSYVLSYLETYEYRDYGRTIIAVLEEFPSPIATSFIMGIGSTSGCIKRRIYSIMDFKKDNRKIKLKELAISFFIGCILLTNPETASTMTNYSQQIDPTKEIIQEDLSRYFEGYEGTFVMMDMKEEQYHIFNEEMINKKVSPYSTFKILSALIGLETGRLEDENTVIKWDGTNYPFEDWNRDHTLASAFQYSTNWYFQKANQYVTLQQMKEYINILNYGNKRVEGDVETFWIGGTLEISPFQQVEFLKDFYTYEIPFTSENIDIVKKTIQLGSDGTSILYGKTASSMINDKSILGWFIGYVERGDDVYFFATKIEGNDEADGRRARNITLKILEDKKIFSINL